MTSLAIHRHAISGELRQRLGGRVVMIACALAIGFVLQFNEGMIGSLQAAGETVPAGYEGARIIDKPDGRVPLDLSFVDETGAKVHLSDYFHGNRPVLLAMVYFQCPRLCNLTLNGLTKAIKPLGLVPGKDFEIVTISFDPREAPALAKAKKAAYIASLGKPEAASGWHFLTNSDPEPAHLLGDAIGFGFKLDAKQEQYLHQAGIYICGPDGRVSRVIEGVEFDSETLRDALIKAAQGNISSGLFGVALSCGLLQYDAATGKYVWAAMMLMRIVAISTMVFLAAVIGTLVYRDNRKNRDARSGTIKSIVSGAG